MFSRSKSLEKRRNFYIKNVPNDIVIQQVSMIDENGKIIIQEKEIEIDETKMLNAVPAYTTKIEYMQQYGTLDEQGIVKYCFARPNITENDILKMRNTIIMNNINKNKVNESKN